jgi:hypothetical protein
LKSSNRHSGAALHPALYGARLRAELKARCRGGHLLKAARTWVKEAAEAPVRNWLIEKAGAVSGDRLEIAARLHGDHGLIVAALDVAGGADRRTRLATRRWTARGRGKKTNRGLRRTARGRGKKTDSRLRPTQTGETRDLEHIAPGRMNRRGTTSQQDQDSNPHNSASSPCTEGFHGTASSLNPLDMPHASRSVQPPTERDPGPPRPVREATRYDASSHLNLTARSCKRGRAGFLQNLCPRVVKLTGQAKVEGPVRSRRRREDLVLWSHSYRFAA